MNKSYVPEHNEAKVTDLTIPMFELEQRIERLEGQFTNLQADLGGQLAENVVAKINSSIDFYLPKVAQAINDLR